MSHNDDVKKYRTKHKSRKLCRDCSRRVTKHALCEIHHSARMKLQNLRRKQKREERDYW